MEKESLPEQQQSNSMITNRTKEYPLPGQKSHHATQRSNDRNEMIRFRSRSHPRCHTLTFEWNARTWTLIRIIALNISFQILLIFLSLVAFGGEYGLVGVAYCPFFLRFFITVFLTPSFVNAMKHIWSMESILPGMVVLTAAFLYKYTYAGLCVWVHTHTNKQTNANENGEC